MNRFECLQKVKGRLFGWILLSPTLLLLLIFGAFPIGFSVYLSFHDYTLTRAGGPEFIGIKNFISLFNNPVFLSSLWKTGLFSLILIIGSTTLGLMLALALNTSFKGKTLYITLALMPWAVPKVVNGLIWKWIYDGNFGILNAILTNLGIISEYKFWFGENVVLAISLIALASIWKNLPFVMIIFLAALQTVPESLYDAATVDGANSWQKFLSVTGPSLRYTFIIVLILQTTWAVKLYDLIQVLTKGGPGNKTMVTYYFVFKESFDYMHIGYGAAAAWVVSLIIFTLAVGYYKFFKGDIT